MKYHQLLSEVLDLADDERALLTVLLLRGAQAPGALRTRTERLHAFADREAGRGLPGPDGRAREPLVRELPRQPGSRTPAGCTCSALRSARRRGGGAGGPLRRRSRASREGAEARDARVRSSYGAVAATYADAPRRRAARDQPFERWLLDRVAADAGTCRWSRSAAGPAT